MNWCNLPGRKSLENCFSCKSTRWTIGGFINPVLLIAILGYLLPMVISVVCGVFICYKAGHCTKSKRHVVNVYNFSSTLLLFHLIIIFMCVINLVILSSVLSPSNQAQATLHSEKTAIRVVYSLVFALFFIYGAIGLVIVPIIQRRCMTIECIYLVIFIQP